MRCLTVPRRRRDAPTVAAGDEVLPGYRVVSLLSQGHRLDTYDVYSHERDCRCVLKTVREDRAGEDRCRTALLREGTLLRDLGHPHLVRAYEAVEQPRAAVVLETLSGATLDALVEESTISPADAALLGVQLTSVLGYLHRKGWLHLDVKPSNIVVQAGRAVLIDLSVACRPGDGRPHAGTCGYMAPEQASGRGLSAGTDVFGVGATLGQALTGELPYGDDCDWTGPACGRTPARSFLRRLAETPAPLADVVGACVNPDPGRRPSLAQLRSVLEQATTPATAPA